MQLIMLYFRRAHVSPIAFDLILLAAERNIDKLDSTIEFRLFGWLMAVVVGGK